MRTGRWVWTCWDESIQAFENEPTWGHLAHNTKNTKRTNMYVCQQVNILAGRQERLLSAVKCHKLSSFSHVCLHTKLPKIIGLLQGIADGNHRSRRPRKSWKGNIKGWTGRTLSPLRGVDDRSFCATITAGAPAGILPKVPGPRGELV